MSEKYQPTQFLVIDPRGGPAIECDNGDEAMVKAQGVAVANPGTFVNIYKHAMCVRTRENGDVPDAG